MNLFAKAFIGCDSVGYDNGWMLKATEEYYGIYVDADARYATLAAALAYAKDAHKDSIRQANDEARTEQYAENAWLRAAEAPTNDDMAFAEHEARRGVV